MEEEQKSLLACESTLVTMILKNLNICDHHIMTNAALIAPAIRLDGLARLPRTQPAWQVGIKPL